MLHGELCPAKINMLNMKLQSWLWMLKLASFDIIFLIAWNILPFHSIIALGFAQESMIFFPVVFQRLIFYTLLYIHFENAAYSLIN